jgi:hypothetical protein
MISFNTPVKIGGEKISEAMVVFKKGSYADAISHSLGDYYDMYTPVPVVATGRLSRDSDYQELFFVDNRWEFTPTPWEFVMETIGNEGEAPNRYIPPESIEQLTFCLPDYPDIEITATNIWSGYCYDEPNGPVYLFFLGGGSIMFSKSGENATFLGENGMQYEQIEANEPFAIPEFGCMISIYEGKPTATIHAGIGSPTETILYGADDVARDIRDFTIR